MIDLIEPYRRSSYSGTQQGSDCVEVGVVGGDETGTG
ncbi:DUF397 domain-containing protein [Actinoallomurus spadix]|nr:DUF397 domain-containing protein [Actinoallomurus spadix]MCO5991150.1 DUF397 domain-containing protein [Actinoallomurus spadix]